MRILLVEDDLALSKVVESIIKKNNYTVDVVHDGKEAFDMLSLGDELNIYDGVVLDLMLPGMDGKTLLKKLRARGNNVPVLILSAKSEIDDKVEGLDSGANDYLTKPFDSKELMARLRVLLRKNTVSNDSVIRIENLSLDCSLCKISTTAGSYELVGKEYQIMLMFMLNYNKVISAEQIMEKIWEMDSEANLKTVWTYISYIRRKLEALDSEIMISTKRNLGYILEKH